MSRPTAAPSRPAASSRRAPALAGLAALAWLAAAAGCTSGPEIPTCPGDEVGRFDLLATRTAASCQDGSGPGADGTAACAARVPPLTVDCLTARPAPDCCFDRLFPPTRTVQAVISYAALGDAAAFCLQRPGAAPYLGTRTAAAGGETITASLETAGAVLSSCAATCAVTVRHDLTGLVARDPESGAVTGFTGVSTEVAAATASAACATCTTPCQATWDLARAPAP